MSKHIMLKYKLIIGSVLLGVRMNSLLETVSKTRNSLFYTKPFLKLKQFILRKESNDAGII